MFDEVIKFCVFVDPYIHTKKKIYQFLLNKLNISYNKPPNHYNHSFLICSKLSAATSLPSAALRFISPEAKRARGRLSGCSSNGFLHGYKQSNYRPGPHINTILKAQERAQPPFLCTDVCVCIKER